MFSDSDDDQPDWTSKKNTVPDRYAEADARAKQFREAQEKAKAKAEADVYKHPEPVVADLRPEKRKVVKVPDGSQNKASLTKKKRARLPVDIPCGSTQAFKPLLIELDYKPNAVVRLSDSLLEMPWPNNADWISYDHPEFFYENPYKLELEKFQQTVLTMSPIFPPRAFTERQLKSNHYLILNHSLEVVNNKSQIKGLINDLKMADFFCVNVHEQKDSYYGYVSLINISTECTDYVIDPYDGDLCKILYKLNEVFTDQLITKVFYNGSKSVVGLQRDFSIYCVNMFDLADAADALQIGTEGGSSFRRLVRDFCQSNSLDYDDCFDSAERPLDDFAYEASRERCRFMPHIYPQLLNMLLQTPQDLSVVLQKGVQYCLKTFNKSFVHDKSYRKALMPVNHSTDQRWDDCSEVIVKRLYEWRDKLARAYDKHPEDTMSTRLINELALNSAKAKELLTRRVSKKTFKKIASDVLRIMGQVHAMSGTELCQVLRKHETVKVARRRRADLEERRREEEDHDHKPLVQRRRIQTEPMNCLQASQVGFIQASAPPNIPMIPYPNPMGFFNPPFGFFGTVASSNAAVMPYSSPMPFNPLQVGFLPGSAPPNPPFYPFPMGPVAPQVAPVPPVAQAIPAAPGFGYNIDEKQ